MKHLLFAALFALATPAHAQSVSDVHFAKGNSGATVSGTIVGYDYADYRLGAKKGQKMTVDLIIEGSNGSGNAFFNILPPGSDGVAIYNGSMDGGTTTITLPQNGTYTVRVYHMGDDRDSNKTTGYRINLSIH